MVTMKKSVTMEAVKSLLLEWDGDGSGLEAVETAGGTLYKVADVIVQNEDIPGMTVTDSEGKETLVTDSVYNDMISRSLVGDGFAAKVAGYVYLAQKAAQAPGAELPAGGIWLLKKQDGSHPKKVVLPAYREAFLQGEKPDGEQGESMGGGGVTSWNDLEDKPFEDARKIEEVNLEWDGNTDGLVSDTDYIGFYKVSDATPAFEDLHSVTVNVGDNGEVSTDAFSKYEDDYSYGAGGYAIYIEGDRFCAIATSPTWCFPEAGLYFINNEWTGNRTISLNFTGLIGEVKTIDPKFLPKPLRFDEKNPIDPKYLPVALFTIECPREDQVTSNWADIDTEQLKELFRKLRAQEPFEVYFTGSGSYFAKAIGCTIESYSSDSTFTLVFVTCVFDSNLTPSMAKLTIEANEGSDNTYTWSSLSM